MFYSITRTICCTQFDILFLLTAPSVILLINNSEQTQCWFCLYFLVYNLHLHWLLIQMIKKKNPPSKLHEDFFRMCHCRPSGNPLQSGLFPINFNDSLCIFIHHKYRAFSNKGISTVDWVQIFLFFLVKQRFGSINLVSTLLSLSLQNYRVFHLNLCTYKTCCCK